VIQKYLNKYENAKSCATDGGNGHKTGTFTQRTGRHAAKKACLFRKADRERWQQYTSEIADPNGAAKLMRAIKKDAFVPPTLLRNNGSFTSSKEETIDLLLSTHFPGSIPNRMMDSTTTSTI
jgi:hypothetical protein